MYNVCHHQARVLRVYDGEVATAVAFYTEVFQALDVRLDCLLDGYVISAEMVVGGHRLVLTEWDEPLYWSVPHECDNKSPLHIEHENPRSLLRQAVSSGARIETPDGPAAGVLLSDPFGQRWLVTSRAVDADIAPSGSSAEAK